VLIKNTIQTFFSILQSGNTTAIESYLGGDLYERRKTLLRNNREYSEFLRRYYQGTEFQIEKITEGSSGVVVTARLIFPDGQNERFLLRLAREQGRGAWKIMEYTGQEDQ